MKRLLLALVVVFIGGCSGLDNRAAIASATLYDDPPFHGGPMAPAPAFTGALNAKFPSGTNIEALRAYVAKLGGGCRDEKLFQDLPQKKTPDTNGRESSVYCQIVISSSFCVKSSLWINAVVEVQSIKQITASRLSESC